METFLYTTAATLAVVVAAGFVVGGTLCMAIVVYVVRDIRKTIKLRKLRRDGMQ
jgi:putative Ca2+/H+ antiporter (TMEM165/GDT1 family)